MLEIVFSDSEKLLLERSNLFNKEDILKRHLFLIALCLSRYFKFNISIIYGKT